MMPKHLSTFNFKSLPKACIASVILFVILVAIMQNVAWSFSYSDDKLMENIIPQLRVPHHYDIVVLGTSHAGELKFRSNPEAIQPIIDQTMIVLAKANAGIIPTTIFLDTFFHYGNTADTILFFIDPFIFISRGINEESACIYNEPLDTSFLTQLLHYQFSKEAIMSYIGFNCNFNHFFTPLVKGSRRPQTTVAEYDRARWDARTTMYQMGSDATFDHYFTFLETLILKHNDKNIILIAPPILLDNDVVTESFDAFHQRLQPLLETYDLVYADHSHVMTDPRYFRDMDHLNNAGFIHYFTTWVAPYLQKDLTKKP